MEESRRNAENHNMRFPQVATDLDLEQAVRIPDQRRTERRELAQVATVSTMGTPQRVLTGEIRNLSEGGTQVWLEEPLPPFALVKVEYDDNLLLGEVVYCQADGIGWLVGFRIEHGLFGLTTLSAAMESF
jgi:hypothetical protein